MTLIHLVVFIFDTRIQHALFHFISLAQKVFGPFEYSFHICVIVKVESI